MGRYYNGDIEGKFWFAVQSSDDASFFGGSEEDREDDDGQVFELEYSFQKKDLEDIEDGLGVCKERLGIYLTKLDQFFAGIDGYNDEMVSLSLKIPKDRVKSLLEWYARYELGLKIKNCVIEKGQCSFFAEL